MKTLKIVSRRVANVILINSLFNPVNGHTLNLMKYDNVKYKWTGKASYYTGREVQVSDSVHAIYVERHSDSDGSYTQFMCVCEDSPPLMDKE